MNIGRSHFAIFMLMTMLICGCSSHDDLPLDQEASIPIIYNTRARTRVSNLEDTYTDFSVRTVKAKDGNSEVVMDNYSVGYKPSEKYGSHWVYDETEGQYLKFWDLSADSYMFAAVAPDISRMTTSSTMAIDDNGDITLSLADLNTDWMVARTIRRGVNTPSSLLDYDDMAEDDDVISGNGGSSTVFARPLSSVDEVPLNFHRILAKVVFKAYAADEMTIDPLEVGLADIGHSPAGFSTADGWTTTPTSLLEVYNQKTKITSAENDREHAHPLTSLFVVPQRLDGPSPVAIKVRQNNDDALNVRLNMSGTWESNTIYTYYLKFDGRKEVILIDVTVAPWEQEGDLEDEVNNW